MIGIFGGTFDPVHYGHLRPLEEVRAALGLAPVLVIPCATPPHRSPPVASAEHRWQMVVRALAGHPVLVADDRELRRGGVSYMVETLIDAGGDYAHETLCLIMGTDALLGFERWHQWQRILTLCNLVVMTRPGWPQGGGDARLPAWAAARQCTRPAELAGEVGRVYLQAVTPIDISATRIRRAIAANENVDALLPPPVRDYICEHGLYGYRADEVKHN
jgi:nicotinate-nucleotide adenylyltransferase